MAPAALGVLVCAMPLEAVIGKRAFVQASVWQQEHSCRCAILSSCEINIPLWGFYVAHEPLLSSWPLGASRAQGTFRHAGNTHCSCMAGTGVTLSNTASFLRTC